MGAGHFPVLLMITMTLTLGLTYTLAVWREDVDPIFPYISATGTNRPESCVFGLLLTVAAFLTLVIIYLRYRLVKELNRGADALTGWLNLAGAALGLISTIGLCIVANFQETAVLSVHLVGAFLCFGFGTLYSILHAIVTHRMHPLYNGRRIAHIRTFLAATCLLAFFIGLSCGVIGNKKYRAATGAAPPAIWSRRGEPGWSWHVASAVAEWILAGAFGLFLLSFSRDFEKLRLGVSVEPLVQHLDETPVSLPRSPSPSRNSPPILA